jgi:Cu/Ag efflux protein CusF
VSSSGALNGTSKQRTLVIYSCGGIYRGIIRGTSARHQLFYFLDLEEKTMNRTTPLVFAVSVGLSAFSVVAISHAETLGVAAGAASSEITGTVVVVNTEKRLMTIREPDGQFQVIQVPEEVKRLDEIKINDKLTIAYTAAVAVDLRTGPDTGAPGTVVTKEIDREQGRKPSGSMAETVTLTGSIKAVNRANSTVTVQGPEETLTLTVKDPELLERVGVGDTVTATFIRAVAAKVEGNNPKKDASGKPGL